MKRDTEQKITLEDLLRLKKAERPAAEFWAKFESDIRSKQLSAIVSKRPWWDGISRIAAIMNRHQLPVGAAAALALTWVGVHYAGGHAETLQASTPARMQPSVATRPVDAAAAGERFSGSGEEVERDAVDAAPQAAPVVTASALHIAPAPAAGSVDAAVRSPFADGIAVTLSDYRTAPANLSGRSIFGSDREFEPTVASSHLQMSEPLARMDPSEERRARLLATALPPYSSGSRHALASDWMRDRSSSDQRMYESMDRGSSDRMLVGFRF